MDFSIRIIDQEGNPVPYADVYCEITPHIDPLFFLSNDQTETKDTDSNGWVEFDWNDTFSGALRVKVHVNGEEFAYTFSDGETASFSIDWL